ncbi:MAG: type III-B CRISPR module RAMP protein Cmr4 [Spirulina sp. SIO3F2]|nr:type III-B CRISPR module RAMP protein Cmr4 [Spirulina sp. SIO3F2]
MNIYLQHLYLIAPLHTGGTTQEGNLLGIARESHTNFPYIPSSTIRGRLRASLGEAQKQKRDRLFGNELEKGKLSDGSENLTQGNIWIGDGSILWLPIPSLSHGVIWISCPLLLNRYARLTGNTLDIQEYQCSFKDKDTQVYLKDAIFKSDELIAWENWQKALPKSPEARTIQRVLVLPDQHCATVVQMGLWRQVKIKLDSSKTVDGGFRYEEAIPPDTLMYFPWGLTAAPAKAGEPEPLTEFTELLQKQDILQIGGQESLGRGFVQSFT